MPMPRPDDEIKEFFASVMPEDARIQLRPMFGNLAAFVNGNMFAGLYGQQIFVRLSEPQRAKLLEHEGTSEFSPMPGRPMKEYVAVPETWREEDQQLRDWIAESLKWVGEMPEKAKTGGKKKSKKQG